MLENLMVIDQDVYVGRQTIQNFDDEIDDCLLSLEDESRVFCVDSQLRCLEQVMSTCIIMM